MKKLNKLNYTHFKTVEAPKDKKVETKKTAKYMTSLLIFDLILNVYWINFVNFNI